MASWWQNEVRVRLAMRASSGIIAERCRKGGNGVGLVAPCTGCRGCGTLRLGEDGATVLDNELHSQVLCVHVRHLTLDAAIEHDGRSEDDSQVFGGHLTETVSSVRK